MAIQTIWSVDLGKSSLKAVKLRRAQGHVEIVAIDKVDYPISGNGGDTAAQAREALAVFAQRNQVREPVAITHPGQGTFSRFIKVPAFDEKKVDEMVRHEATQQIPFPLDEVTWDFHIVDRDYLPGEEREVAIFAVRREQIDDFMLEFTNSELGVETISIGYLGLLNFVQHDVAPDEPSIVLDIGASHTDLVLVDEQRFWIRSLPHSGNEITKSIQDRFKLGFSEAEKLKLETAKVPQKAVKIFQAVIQPKLKELIGEIHRSIGFYRSQYGEVNFSKLYLLGGGSKIIGIQKFLSESLGLSVEKVQSINHFRVARDVNLRVLQAHLPSFAATLGCGLQGLGMAPCEVDLVPAEDKDAKAFDRKKKHAFIGAGIVFLALFISSWLTSLVNSSAKTAIQEAKDEAKPLASVDAQVTAFDAQQDELEEIVRSVRQIAALRGRTLLAQQALDATLAQYGQNQAAKVVTVPDTDAGAVTKLEEEMEQITTERIWVPKLEFTRTTHTFPVFASGGDIGDDDDDDDDDAAPAAAQPVPAYQMKVSVMMRSRNSNDEIRRITTEFAKKLEVEFKNRGLAVVEVSQAEEPRTISIAPPTAEQQLLGPAGAGSSGGSGQQGAPFQACEISWTLVSEIPEVPEPEPDDGDDDDDDLELDDDTDLDDDDDLGDDDDDDDDLEEDFEA